MNNILVFSDQNVLFFIPAAINEAAGGLILGLSSGFTEKLGAGQRSRADFIHI